MTDLNDSTSKDADDRYSPGRFLSMGGSYVIDQIEHPVAYTINAGLRVWAVGFTWAGPIAFGGGLVRCSQKDFLVGAGFMTLGVLLLPLIPLGIVGYVPYSCFKLGWYCYKDGDVQEAGMVK